MGGQKRVYELMLEIGHKSTPLKTKLPNGYTHKWRAFVRGSDNSKIEHCIQRVVFQLHDSFDNPHRVISEPAFQVEETGYAGFEIPIEIYFKNREKPNHIVFIHDLSLLTGKPNNTVTVEKIKFINPNREFEKCLIKSGAQLIPEKKEKKERSNSPPPKKHKSSSLIPSKEMSKPQAQSSQQSKQFIDLFGAPLVYKGNSHHTHPKVAASVDPFQVIQSKIACLSDQDRLQKIVDIIEEAGEWFNLTPKKFEFDLKRLDKKTLNKIEKCLPH